MAGYAITGDVHMIEDRWPERRGDMTKMAVLSGRYMVFCRILTSSVLTVVTAFTRRGNTLVIKHTGGKTDGVMTHPAILGSGNVIYRLTNGRRAVMTAGTITGDAIMAEDGWTERPGGVAKMAVLCGGYVNHCRIFTGGKHTVVTTFTTPGNALMIEY